MNGVRGLAATGLVGYHVWLNSWDEATPFPWRWDLAWVNLALSTTVFFCLSGFLLYRGFASAILTQGPAPLLRAHLTNRVLRIFPPYLVILAAALVATTFTPVVLTHGSEHPDAAWIVTNLTLTHNLFGPLIWSGLEPSWTLTVELCFYLALPLLAFLAARTLGTRRPILAALLPPTMMLVIGVLTKLTVQAGNTMPWDGGWSGVLQNGFLGQADLFACGMYLAVLRLLIVNGQLTLPRWWRPIALTVGVLLLAMSVWQLGMWRQHSATLWNTAAASAITLLVAVIALPGAERAARALDWRPLAYVGVVSYGIILWHMPVVAQLDALGWVFSGGFAGTLANVALVWLIAFGLAVVSWKLIEQPALRHKRSTRAHGAASHAQTHAVSTAPRFATAASPGAATAVPE